jgi:CheY-like chemotaxis protein
MATVLIIDDDPDLRLLTRRLVQTLGAATIEARNGEEGEMIALQQNPDLILLDIMMPVQDGLITCANLRQHGFSGAIVLMSAMPEAAGRQQAADCGASGYISKPMNRAILKEHLEPLLVS